MAITTFNFNNKFQQVSWKTLGRKSTAFVFYSAYHLFPHLNICQKNIRILHMPYRFYLETDAGECLPLLLRHYPSFEYVTATIIGITRIGNVVKNGPWVGAVWWSDDVEASRRILIISTTKPKLTDAMGLCEFHPDVCGPVTNPVAVIKNPPILAILKRVLRDRRLPHRSCTRRPAVLHSNWKEDNSVKTDDS